MMKQTADEVVMISRRKLVVGHYYIGERVQQRVSDRQSGRPLAVGATL
jgi:hypothetical protein